MGGRAIEQGIARAVLPRLGLLLAVTTACLDDLPAPTACPAPAEVTGQISGCLESLAELPTPPPECLNEPTYAACYRGSPARSCVCGDDGCPAADAEACYPEGDCPAAVRARYPDATCSRLGADDIGPALSDDQMCLCGCRDCMSVCDGQGPVWTGIELLGPDDLPVSPIVGNLSFDLRRHYGRAGNFGLYVRARGGSFQVEMGRTVTAPLVAMYRNVPGADPDYLDRLPMELNDDFEEVLLPAFDAYAWSNEDAKPGSFVMVPGYNTVPTLEIDCIVPFAY